MMGRLLRIIQCLTTGSVHCYYRFGLSPLFPTPTRSINLTESLLESSSLRSLSSLFSSPSDPFPSIFALLYCCLIPSSLII
ncbi:hypothetical protein BDW59DRAFT_119369 [Aspergillus cavernicola]|uniref:Uncharacterized protein n=1 Tax=Aspergillus cavernicola TaxID=176166 RepID=A0ABR4HWQ7_9EURO